MIEYHVNINHLIETLTLNGIFESQSEIAEPAMVYNI